MPRYAEIHDGEWESPVMNGYRLMCCDCGLVHRFQFRKSAVGVEFRVWRDERATAAARRKKTTGKRGPE